MTTTSPKTNTAYVKANARIAALIRDTNIDDRVNARKTEGDVGAAHRVGRVRQPRPHDA